MYRILHNDGILVVDSESSAIVMDEVFATLIKLSHQTEHKTVYCIVINSKRERVCCVTMDTKTLQPSFSH